eukprot:11938900-Prorocentrum_lima.AAC.1
MVQRSLEGGAAASARLRDCRRSEVDAHAEAAWLHAREAPEIPCEGRHHEDRPPAVGDRDIAQE